MRGASSGIIVLVGGLGEWFKPAVLKTAEQKCSVSSNLTASASLWQVVRVADTPGQAGTFKKATAARVAGVGRVVNTGDGAEVCAPVQ